MCIRDRYQAATEIPGTKLEDRQVRYGLAGEAAGSAVSSLIGGFTTTAYPQNVALLKVTDEGKTRTRVPAVSYTHLSVPLVPSTCR